MWNYIIGWGISVAYFAILHSPIGNGQTIGKRLLKIQVVGEDGRTVSLLRAAARAMIYLLPETLNTFGSPIILNTELRISYLTWFGNVISIFYILVFIFNFHSRQAVHDILCKTYVVKLFPDSYITTRKATDPSLLRKCGLAAVLLVFIPWAANNIQGNRTMQFTDPSTYSETSPDFMQIPGVMYPQLMHIANKESICFLNYTGKQSPQEIAEQVGSLLSVSYPKESGTIIITRHLNLAGIKRTETSVFQFQAEQSPILITTQSLIIP